MGELHATARADHHLPQPLDLVGIDDLLSAEEKALRAAVRQFCESVMGPLLATADAGGPASIRELALELGKLGLLGMHLEGYGCTGASAVDYGLACLELQACDVRCRDLVTTQASLVMLAISLYGSEQHKTRWLPRLATGELIGCSATSRVSPDALAPPVRAIRHGDDWVLAGVVRDVPYAAVADVAVVRARSDAGSLAFLVPLPSPDVGVTPTHGSGPADATLSFDEARLPTAALLPGATGCTAAAACADDERYGVLWGVMGAARTALGTALDTAPHSPHGVLVDMSLELLTGTLLAVHLGRRKDTVGLQREDVAAGTLTNLDKAMRVCQGAHKILRGQDVTVERHLADLERGGSDASELQTLVAEALIGQRESRDEQLTRGGC